MIASNVLGCCLATKTHGTVKGAIPTIASFAGPPFYGAAAPRQRGAQEDGALFGKMIPRPLLGVVVFTCGFAADAENQVTNEETFCYNELLH